MTKTLNLKKLLLDSSWEESESIAEELILIQGEFSVDFFIECLKSENYEIRNRAALSLKELKSSKSVEPLIEGVIYPIDPKRCGTLASALESHDCSDHIIDIFRIMFYSNYECKMWAHNILSEQSFSFDKRDLIEIGNMWDNCKANPSTCPSYSELNEDIQDDVDSFLDYLDEI